MVGPDLDTNDGEEPAGLMSGLAEHLTIAADAVIAVIARLVAPPLESTTAGVERLGAATVLLVSVGERAGRLRIAIGMD